MTVRAPNVVFILADDMGYGDIGAFGSGDVRTPHLDRLCGEGVRLVQHYSGSPVCAPARAALMTGRYPHRSGAIDTLEGRGLDRLALREVTFGDAFRAAGYATGLIGKWHSGALDPRYHPNRRGFDEFLGFRGGWSDYWSWRLDANGRIRKADGRYLTDVFTDQAVDFIRRHRRERFFLHLAYNAPHFPFQVPDEEVRPFRGTARFTEGVCRVYGMNRRMDAGVGRVLDTLEACDLAERTLVVFTSDNGPQFAGKGEFCLERYNGRFAGCKGHVYEGGIRVPAVCRWPDGLPGGGVEVADMVHFVDWLPTLLEAAGVDRPEGPPLDGASALHALRGEGRVAVPPRFWQWNRYTPMVTCNAAVRNGPWKLLRPRLAEAMQVAPEDAEVDRRLKYEPESVTDITRAPPPERQVPDPPPPMLFHIEDDPWERHDLADRDPQRVRRMLCDLETWFEQVETERRAVRD